MKIIYIGAFRLPNLDAAAPRVLNNARALRAGGCEICFISWGGEYRKQDLCSDGKYRVDGFEYYISGDLINSTSKLERLKAKFFRGLKSLKILQSLEKPDLIILYNSDYFFTKRMLRYCNQRKIKLANDINEWFSNDELHLPDILPNYLNMTMVQKKIKNKIVISSFFDKYYSTSNNILVPPLCDKSESKWSLTLQDDRVPSFNGITLIYAGTPARKDYIHSVVNAVNLLALEGEHIRFVILGITRDAYIKKYYNELKNANLHANIIFLGRVSQDYIPAYYKLADFMVLLREPNRKSMAGFPTKFAESMTAGIPVITNATSDLPNYILTGKTGFLVGSYDYNTILAFLKSNILSLSRSDVELMKAHVLDNNSDFDWKSHIAKFQKFISHLS